MSNLFLVLTKDEGTRPVINLKGLYQFVRTEHFKMEGLHLLNTMVKPGDWFTKVDLKDAYFHVPVHPNYQQFLSFRWEGRMFQFACLPFGLASALDIHKGDETSPCMSAAIGCTVHNVPGRPTDHGTVSGGDAPSDSQYTCAVPGPRLLDKLGEVNPVATARYCFPRPCCELNDLDIVLVSSEIAREIQSLFNKEVVSVRQLAHIVGNSTPRP